jgi:hypothetical protein
MQARSSGEVMSVSNQQHQNYIEAGDLQSTVDSDKPRHQDRYVHYTHQMPDETAEASARVLIRIVPLIYGALMGGLYGNLLAGVLLGLLVSALLDYRMWDSSLLRPVSRRCAATGCPLIAAAARGFATAVGAIGLPAPSAMRQMRCDAS